MFTDFMDLTYVIDKFTQIIQRRSRESSEKRGWCMWIQILIIGEQGKALVTIALRSGEIQMTK